MSSPDYYPPYMQELVSVSEEEFNLRWTGAARGGLAFGYHEGHWRAVHRARSKRRRMAKLTPLTSDSGSITIAIPGTNGLTIKSDPSMPRDTFGFDPGYPGSVVYSLAVDPLDVEYDGVTLRILLGRDIAWRHERPVMRDCAINEVQRSAISAHWSAELRAKVAAAKQKEREQVVVDRQYEP